MNAELREYRQALQRSCRPIHGHGSPQPAAELARVAGWCVENDIEQDAYGKGELLESFECKLAAMFGKQAARFLPSGTMAQAIAMRIWCGPGGHFGMHPTCHLELHEERGYSHLLGLRASLLGPARRAMLPEDLAAVAEPLDALIVELPTRENGGCLPSLAQLEELCRLGRERGIHMHLDGARIWEAQAAYGVPFATLGALFDSVYVSFYKGIGALPGAMLLGPADFVVEAQLWQRRMGGNLYSLLPNVASAASRLDGQLERFPAYLARARSLAAALRELPGVTLLPDPPMVNMMHVHLKLELEAALAARDRVAEESGLWLFGAARPAELEGGCRFELYVGEAALGCEDSEILAGFHCLFLE